MSLTVHRHHHGVLYAIFVFLLFCVAAFLFVGIAGVVFQRIGFTRFEFFGILLVTLAGSFVNIPIRRVEASERFEALQEVRIFWMVYRVPRTIERRVSTLIAVNLGGAVVPVSVSLYLILTHLEFIDLVLLSILVCSIAIHFVARRVKGVGIVTPAFFPPILAALVAFLLFPAEPIGAAVTAYVAGTLGALIGADLSNLRDITKLGAPMVSIGGAGTFDGVFLTGLIAVLLVSLI